MHCPVCGTKYEGKHPGFYKAVYCHNCFSPLLRKLPVRNMVVTLLAALILFLLVVIAYNFFNQLFIGLMVIGVWTLLNLYLSKQAKRDEAVVLDEGLKMRLYAVAVTIAVIFSNIWVISPLCDYAYVAYHRLTAENVIYRGTSHSVVFSPSGQQMAFLRFGFNQQPYLMTYSFSTGQLQQIGFVPKLNTAKYPFYYDYECVLQFSEDEKYVNLYKYEEGVPGRQFTYDLEQKKLISQAVIDKYVDNRDQSRVYSYDERYGIDFDREGKEIYDLSSKSVVKFLNGIGVDCYWSPTEYKLAYVIEEYIPFWGSIGVLCYLDFE